MKASVRCWVNSDQSSHEGSGGGFSVVRFHHLHVENCSASTLKAVRVRYRLMKGMSCFQEDHLEVEQVAPGQTRRSQSFIRDSQLFDRIEWVGAVEVAADPPLPPEAVSFTAGDSRGGSARWIALGTVLLVVILMWLWLR